MSFWELGKLKRICVLGYKLKQKADIFINKDESKEARIDSVFDALDLVLTYKRENPQEFEDIFRTLERFSQKHKSDKEAFDKK